MREIQDYNKPEHRNPWESEAARITDRCGNTIRILYVSGIYTAVHHKIERSKYHSHTACSCEFPGEKKRSHSWCACNSFRSIEEEKYTWNTYGAYTIQYNTRRRVWHSFGVRRPQMDPPLRRKAGLWKYRGCPVSTHGWLSKADIGLYNRSATTSGLLPLLV